MTTKVIDTNVIIRFLTADDQELFTLAKILFQKAENKKINYYLDEVVIAEVVWLLGSFYKYQREKIYNSVQTLVSQAWLINPRKNIILSALEIYHNTRFSYIDCWVAVLSKHLGYSLETFDQKLKKLKS